MLAVGEGVAEADGDLLVVGFFVVGVGEGFFFFGVGVGVGVGVVSVLSRVLLPEGNSSRVHVPAGSHFQLNAKDPSPHISWSARSLF